MKYMNIAPRLLIAYLEGYPNASTLKSMGESLN